MVTRLRRVGSKQVRTASVLDPLHKLVLDTALELLLRRWRHRGLPHSSIMSLYRLYGRELCLESSFCIWWDMWCLFDEAERVVFLQGISLVDQEFAWDMLGVWYRMVANNVYSLEELD